MIQLEKIFREHKIKYSTAGKHATEGHVNIQCPFCGRSDPSFHLGIDIQKGAYHCWRNPKHSGYNLDYVLAKVLKVSKAESRSIITKNSDLTFLPEREKDFDKIWEYMDTFEDPIKYKDPIVYLKNRGFHNIESLCRRYNLKYCNYGEWAGRIIIPIYDDNGSLVSFTARDITGTSGIRYKTLKSIYSKKKHNELLFNSNNRKENKDLILVEGPMDAMRVESVTRSVSCWALMGLELTPGRIEVIKKHVSCFLSVYLVLDNDQSHIKALNMKQELEKYIGVNIKMAFPPKEVKDLGELDNWDLQDWVYKIRRKF